MKKLLSILLTLAIALGVISGSSLTAGASSLLGDVDNDGEVDVIDATLIQRHLVGAKLLDEAAQKRGSVSGKELSITDATLIQRYAAKMIAFFPAEENPEVPDTVTIRFTDNKKWGTVYAYLYNYATGEALEETPGVAMTADGTDSDGKPMYSLDVDVSKYDRVIFNNGGTKQTTATPVTKASSGYYLRGRVGKKYQAAIYPYLPEGTGMGTVKTIKMDYPVISEGDKRDVYIWLPEGYDAADTSKRYSVLYMCDGQNLFGNVANLSGCYWQCQDSISSLMQNGGDGVIVVGVNHDVETRFNELTPDLGMLTSLSAEEYEAYRSEYGDKEWFLHGKDFSDYVVNTLIPYVESHYNTNDVRGIAGSSCGGYEAFFIGMEHPETFRYIGAFSSAFAYATESEWDAYLSKKDFSGDVPRLYLYCGNNENDNTEQWIYPEAAVMESRLAEYGYPADRMVNVIDDDAKHHETFWALYFPELLCWGLDL